MVTGIVAVTAASTLERARSTAITMMTAMEARTGAMRRKVSFIGSTSVGLAEGDVQVELDFS
jgi:hypothetical protein